MVNKKWVVLMQRRNGARKRGTTTGEESSGVPENIKRKTAQLAVTNIPLLKWFLITRS